MLLCIKQGYGVDTGAIDDSLAASDQMKTLNLGEDEVFDT